MGEATHQVTSRGGSLLPFASASADVRSSDDVIAFEGRLFEVQWN